MSNVFVSHRGTDEDTTESEKLASEIRSADHEVFFDGWKIDLADSITERINEGLEGANYLVLCYSSDKDGISTPWMGREWLSTLARQLNGHSVKIVPVMLTGGTPPAILADIKYVDLTKNWDSGIHQLLGVLV